jgi:hypothetical protein
MTGKLLLSLAFAAMSAGAQTTQNPASAVTFTSTRVHKPTIDLGFLGPLKTLAVETFTHKPVHLTVKSIAPGGGEAFGPLYTFDRPSGNWHYILNAEAEASTRRFWTAQTRFRMLHPSIFPNTSPGDSILLEFSGRTRDMPLVPFYGIGPNTAKSALTDYRERETTAGLRVIFPVTNWLGLGGNVENIWPDLSRPDGKTIVDTQDRFNEMSAPGISLQPSFFRTSFFLHPYHAYPAEMDSYLVYESFHDNKGSGYSFQRFRADVRYNFYPVLHGGEPHRDNVFSIHGLYEASFTNGTNRVPFYLMNTLGGSGLDNQATLRGFSDLRFRAPNLLLFQTEYDKRLYKILGMMAFYDTGHVADTSGKLNFSGMRHSFGFGGTVWLAGRVVFRAYTGLGSGEGIHPFFGIANFF